MVGMMQTDVACEPLQYSGKPVNRGGPRRLQVFPVELVLNLDYTPITYTNPDTLIAAGAGVAGLLFLYHLTVGQHRKP
jgi:hypothetical protein